jgi:hypothetical protein
MELRKIRLANPSYNFIGHFPKYLIEFETNKSDNELDGCIVYGLETTIYKTTTTIKYKLLYINNKIAGYKINE